MRREKRNKTYNQYQGGPDSGLIAFVLKEEEGWQSRHKNADSPR